MVKKFMCTYSSHRKVFRNLVDLDEALAIVAKYIELKPRDVETVSIDRAIGRVLAENVYAKSPLPPFDRALYDGYAALSIDISEARDDKPCRLRVVEKVRIGTTPSRELKGYECCEVATGSPIPYPADVVIPIEYTSRNGDHVYVYKRFGKGFGIQFIASDCIDGELIARKGEIITPLLASIMAATGIDRIKVFRKPRIGIIAIGNELVAPGKELAPGHIYESNSVMVMGLLRELGAEPVFLGIIPDNEDMLKKLIESNIQNLDAIITIGGTSAGEEDIVYRVLSRFRPGVVVHGIKVKPGTPTVIAIVENKLIIGLPGFPFSCLVMALTLLPKTISLLTGSSHLYNIVKKVKGRLLAPVKGIPGFMRFIPAISRYQNNELRVFPLPLESAYIAKLRYVNSFVVIPPNREFVSKNEFVDVVPLKDLHMDILFIGSHDPLVDDVLAQLELEHGFRIFKVFIGSMGGVRACIAGIADIAGVHLYSPRYKVYNEWIITEFDLKDYTLIRGFKRIQGFILRPNIESVKSFMDIIEKGLRFVNRNSGSGTRYLIELMIEKEAREHGMDVDTLKSRIQGFNYELHSHDAIALAIKSNKADIGVGIEYVAKKYNLKFIPLAEERYDFIVRKDLIDSDILKIFIEKIKKFINSGRYPGYSMN